MKSFQWVVEVMDDESESALEKMSERLFGVI